ncbi:helix-turn-helix domain-containing protein [Timonella senegalensis]|uniref:winged helix-turn-helix transcriptional regulator n=1 Tax=Timonella senegalensis TaxID=1465825 RepID=UPI002FDE72AB
MEANPYDRNCPSRRLLDRIGDRWTVLVVGILSEGPTRFGEIARQIDGISRKLEADGIVSRRAYPEVPPRVEYSLTDAGRSLKEPLKALESWAREHFELLDSVEV